MPPPPPCDGPLGASGAIESRAPRAACRSSPSRARVPRRQDRPSSAPRRPPPRRARSATTRRSCCSSPSSQSRSRRCSRRRRPPAMPRSIALFPPPRPSRAAAPAGTPAPVGNATLPCAGVPACIGAIGDGAPGGAPNVGPPGAEIERRANLRLPLARRGRDRRRAHRGLRGRRVRARERRRARRERVEERAHRREALVGRSSRGRACGSRPSSAAARASSPASCRCRAAASSCAASPTPTRCSRWNGSSPVSISNAMIAERVDVAARVDRLPGELLRAHVRRRAEHHALLRELLLVLVLFARPLRNPEVEDLHEVLLPRALGEHDVVGLQVAVDDAAPVRLFERAARSGSRSSRRARARSRRPSRSRRRGSCRR